MGENIKGKGSGIIYCTFRAFDKGTEEKLKNIMITGTRTRFDPGASRI
jgi:hypothetical protein